MKKTLSILTLIVALASGLAKAQPKYLSATDLIPGVSFPLTITPGQAVTFTVETSNYTRFQFVAEIYVTATAASTSVGWGIMPCDAAGNSVTPSGLSLTQCAAAQGGFCAPTYLSFTASNMMTFYSIPFYGSSTVQWILSNISAATGGQQSASSASTFATVAFPKIMLFIQNKDSGTPNAAGFQVIIRNIYAYLRSN